MTAFDDEKTSAMATQLAYSWKHPYKAARVTRDPKKGVGRRVWPSYHVDLCQSSEIQCQIHEFRYRNLSVQYEKHNNCESVCRELASDGIHTALRRQVNGCCQAVLVAFQCPRMKAQLGSSKIKIAETLGIALLYPHVGVSQSFSKLFFAASKPRFHPGALI